MSARAIVFDPAAPPADGEIVTWDGGLGKFVFEPGGGGGGSAKPDAVLVVAASNSRESSGADYVCDGVDDQVQVQAALDALAAVSKKGYVLLLDGDFNFSGMVDVTGSVHNGLGVIGSGMHLTRVQGNPGMGVPYFDLSQAAGVTLTQFWLADFFIDGSTAVNKDTYVGLDFGFVLDNGLGVCEHITIERLRIYARDFGYSGSGIVSHNIDAAAGPNRHWKVRGCHIVSDSNTAYGVKFQKKTHGILVESNYIELTKPVTAITGEGGFNNISIYGSSTNFRVANNFCKSNENHSPIAISPASRGTITGNVVWSISPEGSEAGIEVEYKAGHGDDSDTSHDVAVVGNTVIGCYWGIVVINREGRGAGPGDPTNIVISGNTCRDCSSRGVLVQDGINVSVGPNTYQNCGTDVLVETGVTLGGSLHVGELVLRGAWPRGIKLVDPATGATKFELQQGGRAIFYEQIQWANSGVSSFNKTLSGNLEFVTLTGQVTFRPNNVLVFEIRGDNFVYLTGRIKFTRAGDWQTTVGAAGAAAALPATPTKYLKVMDDLGNTLVVPAYEDV